MYHRWSAILLLGSLFRSMEYMITVIYVSCTTRPIGEVRGSNRERGHHQRNRARCVLHADANLSFGGLRPRGYRGCQSYAGDNTFSTTTVLALRTHSPQLVKGLLHRRRNDTNPSPSPTEQLSTHSKGQRVTLARKRSLSFPSNDVRAASDPFRIAPQTVSDAIPMLRNMKTPPVRVCNRRTQSGPRVYPRCFLSPLILHCRRSRRSRNDASFAPSLSSFRQRYVHTSVVTFALGFVTLTPSCFARAMMSIRFLAETLWAILQGLLAGGSPFRHG